MELSTQGQQDVPKTADDTRLIWPSNAALRGSAIARELRRIHFSPKVAVRSRSRANWVPTFATPLRPQAIPVASLDPPVSPAGGRELVPYLLVRVNERDQRRRIRLHAK